jgi:hypothetical protein
MFARMHVLENAGVAGYSEAFMYGQSGKQASIGSGYFITDVLFKQYAISIRIFINKFINQYILRRKLPWLRSDLGESEKRRILSTES